MRLAKLTATCESTAGAPGSGRPGRDAAQQQGARAGARTAHTQLEIEGRVTCSPIRDSGLARCAAGSGGTAQAARARNQRQARP